MKTQPTDVKILSQASKFCIYIIGQKVRKGP